MAKLTGNKIKSKIFEFYKLPDLIKTTRNRKYVDATRAISYFCRNLTDLSTTDIGNIIGRDHSTVMHSIKRVKDLILFDKQYAVEINEIKKMFIKPKRHFLKIRVSKENFEKYNKIELSKMFNEFLKDYEKK